MPSKAKPAARGRRKTGTQAAASAADTVEAQAYQQLVQFAKVDTTLKLRVVGDEKGNGLMATRAHKAGQVCADGWPLPQAAAGTRMQAGSQHDASAHLSLVA